MHLWCNEWKRMLTTTTILLTTIIFQQRMTRILRMALAITSRSSYVTPSWKAKPSGNKAGIVLLKARVPIKPYWQRKQQKAWGFLGVGAISVGESVAVIEWILFRVNAPLVQRMKTNVYHNDDFLTTNEDFFSTTKDTIRKFSNSKIVLETSKQP